MDLNQVIILILNTIDMSQSLSIGVFLILINRKKKNALTYLGFFLMSLGVISFSEILEVFNIDNKNSYLNLPFYFFWLTPILLYLYVEKISILPKHKYSSFLLMLGTIELLISIIIYFLSSKDRLKFEESLFFVTFQIVGLLFGFYLIIVIFLKVKKHSQLLKKQYSSIEGRDLKWINQFIIFSSFTFIIILPLSLSLLSGFVIEILFSVFSIIITYWISYNGLSQLLSVDLIKETDNKSKKEKNNGNSDINMNTTDFDIEKYKSVLLKIENEIEKHQLFLNPELTIVQIAERVNEHPRLISKTINTLVSENFNTYINKFRVEKAKIMLLNGASNQLNIEGIGREVGFKSNSSFYAAFKKQLHLTPLKFVKVVNE